MRNFYFVLIILASCCLITEENQVLGPYVFTYGASLAHSVICDDSSMMFTTTSDSFLKIYANDGTNFTLIQNISISSSSAKISVTGNGDLIALSVETGVNIYQRANSGQFIEVQTFSDNFKTLPPKLSKYGSYLAHHYNSTLIQIFQRISNSYSLIYNLSGSNFKGLQATDDFSQVAVASGSDVIIYQKVSNTFVQSQLLTMAFTISSFSLSSGYFMVNSLMSDIYIYKSDPGGSYIFQQIVPSTEFFVVYSDFHKNGQKIVYAGFSVIHVLQRVANGSFVDILQETLGSSVNALSIDDKGLFFMIQTTDNTLRVYFQCPTECGSCSFPNNCSSCADGYVLNGVTCVPRPTNCVKNIYLHGDVCEQYCHKKCKTCNQTWTDCYECADYYSRNEEGKCVIADKTVEFLRKARGLFNLVRKKGFKFFFLSLDDLWLYNFHSREYDGVVKNVFEMIKLIEQKQWDLIGLDDEKEQVQEIMNNPIKLYNVYSNPTYLEKQRNNSILYDSLQAYIVFYLPTVMVFVFLMNRVFYLLFNYQISVFFRPYAFWLILVELMVMNNIQFFTFLGFRTFQTPFYFQIASRSIIASIIVLYFFVFLFSFASYTFYYETYKKLARYFLVNLYRFPKSYLLMTMLYGMRPFLKGCTHALMYQNWQLQIILLLSNDVCTIIILIVFQYFVECHKSKIVFSFEMIYTTGLAAFNALLLCKYRYFPEHSQRLEHIFEAILILMLVVLVLRLVLQLLETINCQSLRNFFCCCCPVKVGQQQDEGGDGGEGGEGREGGLKNKSDSSDEKGGENKKKRKGEKGKKKGKGKGKGKNKNNKKGGGNKKKSGKNAKKEKEKKKDGEIGKSNKTVGCVGTVRIKTAKSLKKENQDEGEEMEEKREQKENYLEEEYWQEEKKQSRSKGAKSFKSNKGKKEQELQSKNNLSRYPDGSKGSQEFDQDQEYGTNMIKTNRNKTNWKQSNVQDIEDEDFGGEDYIQNKIQTCVKLKTKNKNKINRQFSQGRPQCPSIAQMKIDSPQKRIESVERKGTEKKSRGKSAKSKMRQRRSSSSQLINVDLQMD